jgi:hypothetical protein
VVQVHLGPLVSSARSLDLQDRNREVRPLQCPQFLGAQPGDRPHHNVGAEPVPAMDRDLVVRHEYDGDPADRDQGVEGLAEGA